MIVRFGIKIAVKFRYIGMYKYSKRRKVAKKTVGEKKFKSINKGGLRRKLKK